MTAPRRSITILFTCIGLALLALSGTAASLDLNFILSPDEVPPFAGADDTPTPDIVSDIEFASLNRSSLLSLDGAGIFPGPDATLTAGAVPSLENPAFLQYQEAREMTNGEMLLCAAVPENETFRPCTGLLPSPATLVGSEGAADLTVDHPNTNLCIKGFTRDPLPVPGDYATIQGAVDTALPE